MLQFARDVVRFTDGKTRETLDQDIILTRAMTWTMGVIGEAASKISPKYQETQPEIPWAQIVGMRNRLFHDSFEIDFNILWDTVNVSIPPLVAQLEEVLTREDD
jgi:uncharacterized protein with HEPN domain